MRSSTVAAIAGILVWAVTAAPASAQLIVPGYGLYGSPYYNPYLWNNWNPYVNRQPSVVVENRPVFRNDNVAPEGEPKDEPMAPQPATPNIPLSAPLHVIRWTGVGRIPILKTTIGTNGGRTTVTFEVNGRPETFGVDDSFIVGNISYRVAAISIENVSLVAQQSWTLR